MRSFALILSLCAMTGPAFAQTIEGDEDFDTGFDSIVVEPLDDTIGIVPLNDNIDSDDADLGGTLGGGLSLEDLQSIPNDGGFLRDLRDVTTQTQEKVASANGATIRILDKLTGRVADLELTKGSSQKWGYLTAELGDCRYPEGNPAGDAYAYLRISIDTMDAPAFEGWMVASSPALNAMDHPRYDVWPLSCSTS